MLVLSHSHFWPLLSPGSRGVFGENSVVHCTIEIRELFSEKPNAEQGARANDHGCHAACYLTNDRIETTDSDSSGCTRRASHGRGSSLTLGKAPAHHAHNTSDQELQRDGKVLSR